MPFKQHGRQYDLVVLGATGYTGLLTAEHIAKNLPTDLRWAVAGRTHSKLQNVVDECRKLDPNRIEPTIEIASTDNQEELDELVRKTYILITTVGPYAKYGEPVVRACAQQGTHYLDVTGEFPWTYQMTKTYQDVAEKSGACIFPQIGIESTPADICTYSLVRLLREELGTKTADVTISLHKISGGPSGGTISSALGVFDHFTPKEIQASSRPYCLSPVPHAKPLRPARSWLQKNLGPVYVPHLGLLSTSIPTSTDGVVVERSWGVLQQLPGREKESYGPNFRWQELARVRNWLHGALMHWGLIFCGIVLATLPPLRSFLRGKVTQPGQGPTREAMAKEHIEYRGTAQPDSQEHPNKRAYIRAFWNGGMYDVTAMFLGQAALTLLKDEGQLGLTKGGFFTPACLGQDFIDRCNDNGFKMELKMVEN